MPVVHAPNACPECMSRARRRASSVRPNCFECMAKGYKPRVCPPEAKACLLPASCHSYDGAETRGIQRRSSVAAPAANAVAPLPPRPPARPQRAAGGGGGVRDGQSGACACAMLEPVAVGLAAESGTRRPSRLASGSLACGPRAGSRGPKRPISGEKLGTTPLELFFWLHSTGPAFIRLIRARCCRVWVRFDQVGLGSTTLGPSHHVPTCARCRCPRAPCVCIVAHAKRMYANHGAHAPTSGKAAPYAQ